MTVRAVRTGIGVATLVTCSALLLWIAVAAQPRNLGELLLFSGLMAAANAEAVYLFSTLCCERHRASQGRWMMKVILVIHGLLFFGIFLAGVILALLECASGYHPAFAVHAVFCSLLCLVTTILVSES